MALSMAPAVEVRFFRIIDRAFPLTQDIANADAQFSIRLETNETLLEVWKLELLADGDELAEWDVADVIRCRRLILSVVLYHRWGGRGNFIHGFIG